MTIIQTVATTAGIATGGGFDGYFSVVLSLIPTSLSLVCKKMEFPTLNNQVIVCDNFKILILAAIDR